ncbi:MAG: hypothetical protein QXI19_03100 [Candidatus Caldarchaeum sp.]
MCIIVIKNRGVTLDKALLHTCFENNPDGAGIAWADGQWVHVIRGLMTLETLGLALESFSTELEKNLTVFHFRQATVGGVLPALTHPFPLPAYADKKYSTMYKAKAVLFHNGHISGLGSRSAKGDKIRSDTLALAECLSDMCAPDRQRMLNFLVETGQKFTILTPSGVALYGKFITDLQHSGYKFSNSTYKPDLYKGWDLYKWRNFEFPKTGAASDSDEVDICEFCYGVKGVMRRDGYMICEDCYHELRDVL